MTEEKKAAKETPKEPSFIEYVSKEPEPMMFDVAYPGGGWICEGKKTDGRLTWRVRSDQTKNFEKHHFFLTGRILKV